MQGQVLHQTRKQQSRSATCERRPAGRPHSRGAWRRATAPFRVVTQFVMGVFYFLVSIVGMVAAAAISILAVPIAIFAGVAVFALLIMAVGGVMGAFL